MRVALVGTGLQARRRLPSITGHPSTTLAVVVGADLDAARRLAHGTNARAADDWQSEIISDEVDVVVVCTPPDLHLAVGGAALSAGKHVLCEKPLTQSAATAQQLVDIARDAGVLLKCGFNHRHHPALWEARRLVADGVIGSPVHGRGSYGICGRPGLEGEWRSDPARAAGGQLMEQGIHLVDLFRWLAGDFESVYGVRSSTVFEIAPLEDTGLAVLRQTDGFCATVLSSLAQWRNRFQLDLYGSEGYVEVSGLGASYGIETLRVGRRDPFGPFTEQVTEFRGTDSSWAAEWRHFIDTVIAIDAVIGGMSTNPMDPEGTPMEGTGADGVAAMRLIEAAYTSAATGDVVRLADVQSVTGVPSGLDAGPGAESALPADCPRMAIPRSAGSL